MAQNLLKWLIKFPTDLRLDAIDIFWQIYEEVTNSRLQNVIKPKIKKMDHDQLKRVDYM